MTSTRGDWAVAGDTPGPPGRTSAEQLDCPLPDHPVSG